jgi:mRNA-degrading endonuclease RelE of RelBE toxin-antitoxin system
MAPKSKPKAILSPDAFEDLKKLPGNIRRLLIPAIDDLEADPRPHNSKQLLMVDEPREIRRLRIDKWRILYLVIENRPVVIGIKRRPPYDYSDLQHLIEDIGSGR